MKLWAKREYDWADRNVGLWSPVLTGSNGSALLDSSLNNNDHATLTNYSNVNTAWVGTNRGTSVNFTGATWAIPQNTRSVFPLGFSARTMACWFIHNAGNSQEIMAYGGNAGSGQRFALWPQLASSMGVEISGFGYQVDYTRNSEFRFLVATLSGLTSTLTDACKIYLDGLEGVNYQAFGTATAINTQNTGMTFGTISGAPNNNNFNGRILEAWVLPYTATPGQILSAYQAGPGGMFNYQPPRRRSYLAQVFKHYWNRNRQLMIGGGIR
jgi:hypothetical protein